MPETKAIGDHLSQDEDPIHWVLFTTHPTHNVEQAQQIIRYYTLRWIIEQLFQCLLELLTPFQS